VTQVEEPKIGQFEKKGECGGIGVGEGDYLLLELLSHGTLGARAGYEHGLPFSTAFS
jgi:hypothetical protein